ncbi:unnamed protein product [Trichobilharzia szidati]|nr:unnamed protein product [Trichobilharzia szidati]
MEPTCVKTSEHRLDDWLIILKEHHILKSLGPERKAFEESVDLPAIPEMIFDQNSLSIYFCQSKDIETKVCKIDFNALDALKLVDPKNITVEVPFAKDWRESRSTNNEELVAHKPYDWTFTTPYTGTLSGKFRIIGMFIVMDTFYRLITVLTCSKYSDCISVKYPRVCNPKIFRDLFDLHFLPIKFCFC